MSEASRHLQRLICAIALGAAMVALPNLARADLGTGTAQPSQLGGPHLFETNGAALDREAFPLQVVTVGEPPAHISPEAWTAVVETSVATWSSVPCSYVELDYAGHRVDRDALADGEVPVVFDDGSCAPDELAAWTTFTPCGGFPARAIFLNSANYEWTIEPQPFQERPETGGVRIIDVESAVTHELGHVLGLSHPDDRLATMYASYKPDGSMRSLALDDKLGICTLYEADAPAPECGTEMPCPEPATCAEAGGFKLCEEFRGGVGDQCGLDHLVCERECALVDQQTGYCTTECETSADCPEAFECVDGFLRPDEAHCAKFDPEEPPRGCCSTGTSGRPSDGRPALLAFLVVSIVSLRRRAAA
ncbi:MAG: matrixin family metalloprotease [Myxococcota bacterium]